MAFLEAYRPQAKNEAMLETLIAYLHAREAWIPNYRQRRINQQYASAVQELRSGTLPSQCLARWLQSLAA